MVGAAAGGGATGGGCPASGVANVVVGIGEVPLGEGDPGVDFWEDHGGRNRRADLGPLCWHAGGSGSKLGDCWSLGGILEDRRQKLVILDIVMSTVKLVKILRSCAR